MNAPITFSRTPAASGTAGWATWRSRSSARCMRACGPAASARPAWKSFCRPARSSSGWGTAYTVFEPFAMWGQILPRNSFLQLHGGVELPVGLHQGRAGGVSPHGRRDHLRAGPGLRPRVVAAGRGAVGPAAGRRRRSGTSCRRCRSRCRSSSTSWSPAASGFRSHSARNGRGRAGLSAVGLVRRRLLRVLEMSRVTRPVVLRRVGVAVRASCSRRCAPTRRSRPDHAPPGRRDAATSRCSRRRATAWRATTISSRRAARTSRSARAGGAR